MTSALREAKQAAPETLACANAPLAPQTGQGAKALPSAVRLGALAARSPVAPCTRQPRQRAAGADAWSPRCVRNTRRATRLRAAEEGVQRSRPPCCHRGSRHAPSGVKRARRAGELESPRQRAPGGGRNRRVKHVSAENAACLMPTERRARIVRARFQCVRGARPRCSVPLDVSDEAVLHSGVSASACMCPEARH